MQNIADIYDEIVKKDKATGNNSANLLLETVAGKNRSNIAASIFQNSTILRSAYESAQNAEGTGQEELDKKMDSIEMKINEFRNAVSKLASDWIDTGFVSMVVEGATTVVKFIDAITNAIGGLASTITVLLGLLTGKNLMDKILGTTNSDGSKKDWWWKTLKEFTEGVKGVTQEGFEEAINTKAIDDNTRSLEANSAAQVRNNAVKGEGALVNATDTVAEDANSASNLENATSNDIDTASQNGNNASKIAGATANSTKGTSYIGGKLRSLGGLFGKGGAKIGGLLGIGATGGSLVLGGVITAAVVGITAFVAKQAQAEKQAKAIAEAYKEAEGNIKSATDEMNKAKSVNVEEKAKAFSDLAKGVNLETNANISLTTEQYEEFLSISKEISELYPELTNGYDENGNALVDLSADVDTVTESLKKLKDQQIADAEQEIVNNLDDYVKGYNQNIYDISNKSLSAKENSYEEHKQNLKELKNFAQEYSQYIEVISNADGTISYRFDLGNYQDMALEALGKFEYLLGQEGYTTYTAQEKRNNWTTTDTIIKDEYGMPIETSLSGVEVKLEDDFSDYLEEKSKQHETDYKNYVESEKSKQEKWSQELNKNLLSWVHQQNIYVENEELKSPIDTIISSINWSDIDTKNWGSQEFQDYLTKNYITPIRNVLNSDELKDQFVDALTLTSDDFDGSLEEYVSYVEDLQEKLYTNGINIPITPVVEDEKKVLDELDDNLKNISGKINIPLYDTKGFVNNVSQGYDEKGNPLNNLEEYNKLKEYLSDNDITTKAEIEEWNSITQGAKNATEAIERYKIAIANKGASSARVTKIMEDYNMALNKAIEESGVKLRNGIDEFDIVENLINKRYAVTEELTEAYEALQREQEKALDWGIEGDVFSTADFANGKFGNIDMDNRYLIEYNEEFLEANKEAMQSWNNYYDDVYNDIKNGYSRIDTVFGDRRTIEDLEIAYSPILQTDNGKSAKFISQKNLENYLTDIVKSAKENLGKGYTQEELYNEILHLDETGNGAKNGKAYGMGKDIVKGLIAGVSDSVEGLNKVDFLMHFSGEYGSVSIAQKTIQEAADKAGISFQQMLRNIRFAIDNEGLSNTLQQIIGEFDVDNMIELEKYLGQLQELAKAAGKDVTQYMKDYQAKELAKEIDALWNGEDFKDKRKDLEKLARTSGVTAKDISELAAENETLASVLDASGMSAEYLASVFNDMCLDGSSAMDTLNSDVMELNRVFDEMVDRIKESSDEYDKLQSSLEQGDYNDGYLNRQQVSKDLTEDFRKGEFGKDAKRRFFYLYANDKNREELATMSNQEMIDYHNARKKYTAEMETEEKNGKTVVKKKGGQNGYQFAKMLATDYGDQLKKKGIDINYNSKSGALNWKLSPEDIPYIAQLTGFANDYITDMFEGLGMYGNIKNYDTKQFRKTLRGLSSSVTYKKGNNKNTLISAENYKRMLEKAGLEEQDVAEKTAELREMKGFDVLDFTDYKKDNVKSIKKKLIESGEIDASDGVQLSEVVDSLSGLGLTTDEIIAFTEALTECGDVVDDFGEKYRKQDIATAVKEDGTSLLNSNYAQIRNEAKNALLRMEEYKSLDNFKLKDKDLTANFNVDTVENADKEIEKWKKLYDMFEKNADGTLKIGVDTEGARETETVLLALISQKQKLANEEVKILGVDSALIDDEVKQTFVSEVQNLWSDIDKLELNKILGIQDNELEKKVLQQFQNLKENDAFDLLKDVKIDKKDLLGTAQAFKDKIGDESIIELLDIQGAIKTSESAIDKMANNINKLFEGDQELKIKVRIDGDKAILDYLLNGAKGTKVISNDNSQFIYTGIDGDAYGNAGVDKDQTALVNELGNESIVRDGKLFEIKGGAHFEKLRKNDIIFNHKQTEELKKKGKLSGNGRGKLIGGSSAFAHGTFKGSVAQLSKAYAEAGVDNPDVRDNSSDNKKEKKSKSQSKETFDWIEVLLSRIQRTIAKLETSVNNVYIAWRKREQDLKREEKNVKKEISYQEQGAKRYQKEANKYVGGIRKYAGSKKKGDDYIKKIQEGRIDIETIKYTSGEDGKKTDKEQLVEKLKLYQQWFEKSIACKDAVEELKIKESELAKQRFDNIVSKYDDKLSNYSNEKTVLEEKINQRQAIRSAKPLKEQKSLDMASIKDYQSLIKNTQQQANMLNTKSKKMQESFNKAVSSGKILKGSSAWYEMRNAIEAVKQEEQQCTSEILNYNEAIRGLYVEQFDKVTERFENMLAVNEHKSNMLNESINQAGMKGQIISDSYYKKLIAVEENNNEKLKNQRKQQRDSLEQAMKDGAVVQGDENWYKMTAAIDATTEAIQKSNTTLLEYNNNLKNLAYERFEFLQEQISSLNDEADFLIELMSDENIFNTVKEKDGKVIGGEITSEGQATLGLHGQKMNTYMSQAEYYKNEAAKIDENTTNKEDLAKRKEYIKLQQDSILNAKKEKQAMKSLVQEGYQKQLEALKKTIDLYNKSLDSQKSLYDYQKNIRDQSKNVTDIQKQLAAYEGDTSEESRAKVQELKKNLKEAQENLKETEYEHYISSQKELLDDVYNKYEQNLNDALENTDKLIREVVTGINTNADTINTTLNTKLTEVGSSMSSAMSTVWKSDTPLSSSWGKITNDTGVGVAINGIDGSVQNLITSWAKGSEHANPGSATEQYTGETVPQTNPQTTTVNNPSTTTPQSKYSDKTLGGIIAEYKKKDNPKKLSKKEKEKLKSKIGTDLISYLKYKGYSTTKAALKDYYGVLFNSTKYTGTKNQNKKLLEAIKNSGYASGIRRIKENELAWTQEKGREAIIRPSDGAILTPLAKGDSVLKASATSNLFDFANNPAEFINGLGLNMDGNPNVTQNTVTNNSNVNLEVTLPNVKNYEDFKYAMQHDKNFEKMIQSMTTDRLFGGSSLKKYR